MSYLIGEFSRYHSNLFRGREALPDVKIVDNITRENLLRAKGNDDYQIINLLTLEYYNPELNKWVKFNRADT